MTLVLGIGNPLRGDDAAGLVVTERLRSARLREGVRVIEREGEPTDLIEELDAAGEVIVVDAVRSGAEPGTVHRVDALTQPLPDALGRTSSHAFGIADTIELARALGRLPRSLEVYGIEGREFRAGAALSPEVERAATGVASELLERLGEP